MFRRGHAGLAKTDQAIRRDRTELGKPFIVGAEHFRLIVKVRMVAEKHPQAGIDDLAVDAVLILVEQPLLGVPSANKALIETSVGAIGQRLAAQAGPRRERDRKGVGHPVDYENIAALGGALELWRGFRKAPRNPAFVNLWRLGDVRICRNDRLVDQALHNQTLPYPFTCIFLWPMRLRSVLSSVPEGWRDKPYVPVDDRPRSGMSALGQAAGAAAGKERSVDRQCRESREPPSGQAHG